MKPIYLVLLCLISWQTAGAQSLDRQLLSPSGGNFVGSEFLIDWSFGEVATQSNLVNSIFIVEGFNQPSAVPSNTTNVNTASAAPLTYKVYPNPSADWLSIQKEQNYSIGYELYNASGEAVNSGNIQNQKHFIALNNLSPQTYFLKIVDPKTKRVSVFKILKTK